MKKALALALVMAFVVAGVASGQGVSALPGSGWWTSAGIQNVGTDTATVTLTAYPAGAGTNSSNTTTIAAGGGVTFLPGSTAAGTVDVTPTLASGFIGSMVIASDQPLVAIGQVGNNQLANPPLGTAGGYASGMYRGAGAGAATITFPTVKNDFGGKTSHFYIQATGSDVTIAATIKANDGTSHTYSTSITANKSVYFMPDNFTLPVAKTGCGSANTSPCVGSLTVVATGGTVAGVAIESDTSVAPATRGQVASTFASTDAATTIYCPVFKNNYGNRYTGITVQNVSGGIVNFYATLNASLPAVSGPYTAVITNVADGGSQTFTSQLNNVGGFPNATYGSMVITSTGNILAAVNEANFNAAPYKATTYTCFAAAAATTKIAFPQVKENFGVNTTGVSVQNVGTADTTINATYTCAGVTYTHVSVSLAKGATYTYYKPSGSAANWSGTALPTNQNCAVVVTAAQSIVGVAQEAATTSLDTKNYEGFNLTP